VPPVNVTVPTLNWLSPSVPVTGVSLTPFYRTYMLVPLPVKLVTVPLLVAGNVCASFVNT